MEFRPRFSAIKLHSIARISAHKVMVRVEELALFDPHSLTQTLNHVPIFRVKGRSYEGLTHILKGYLSQYRR